MRPLVAAFALIVAEPALAHPTRAECSTLAGAIGPMVDAIYSFERTLRPGIYKPIIDRSSGDLHEAAINAEAAQQKLARSQLEYWEAGNRLKLQLTRCAR